MYQALRHMNARVRECCQVLSQEGQPCRALIHAPPCSGTPLPIATWHTMGPTAVGFCGALAVAAVPAYPGWNIRAPQTVDASARRVLSAARTQQTPQLKAALPSAIAAQLGRTGATTYATPRRYGPKQMLEGESYGMGDFIRGQFRVGAFPAETVRVCWVAALILMGPPPLQGGGNHLEERLLDQAQARASYTPLFWGHSRSIPQGMILDVQPLVKSLFCPIRASPNGFFDFEASTP